MHLLETHETHVVGKEALGSSLFFGKPPLYVKILRLKLLKMVKLRKEIPLKKFVDVCSMQLIQ